MKLISYSIYKDNPKYFNFYLRGLYFNMRMIKLMLPDWEMVLNVSKPVYEEYYHYLNMLRISTIVYDDGDRCRNMMQRFKPAFTFNADRVLCRDADSCLTYREVLEIKKWEESGLDWHGINDNQAHTIPMMGGMIGFKTNALKNIFPNFNILIDNWDLSRHGSDQQLIMERIYPHAKSSFYHSNLTNREPQPQQNPHWESDLVQRYIGSAGIIEMEALRFLERMDPTNNEWQEFEKLINKLSNKLLYWHE